MDFNGLKSMAATRPMLNSTAFATRAVEESQIAPIIPSELNQDEHAAYIGYYAIRRAEEWRPNELKVLCELARLAVRIEQLSKQCSVENFDDPATIAKYEKLCRMRDSLQRPLSLHTITQTARTMASQKIAADIIVNRVAGTPTNVSVLHPNTKQKINWDEALK